MPLQATSGAASYDAFGGGVPVVPAYIEDVFSTWLYNGNSSTQTITNGIDLSGKGGLTWIKVRDFTYNHYLYDTARGVSNALYSNATDAQASSSNFASFDSTGFTLNSSGGLNNSSYKYTSWTFREQPKFFDVVTYTGNGTNGRTVAHSLGSVPGCMIVKRTDASNGWAVYHRSMNASPQDYMMRLNATDAAFTTSPSRWNNTLPTATEFTLSGNDEVNGSGATYVAYLFAHDAGGFGLAGTDNVISCGSYTATGNDDIELGFEPQWILHKRANTDSAWYIQDVQRGMALTASQHLSPNTSSAEGTFTGNITSPTATGFHNGLWSSGTIIYIAIRRGPMKVPTSGTSVFAPVAYTGNGTTNTVTTGFVTDLVLGGRRNQFAEGTFDRLRGNGNCLVTATTGAESGASIYDVSNFAVQNGFGLFENFNASLNATNQAIISWNFKRAPSFFDEVCYTGNSSNPRTITHNLTVAPEMMIFKNRTNSDDWSVYHAGMPTPTTSVVFLNLTDAVDSGTGRWNSTAPTASVFSLGGINQSANNYVAYLFATCAGVSKVGSYTGNGSTQTINCGFTGGARFVLIKKTSGTGDWMVSDSARGIVSGNDPYLELNNTNAEVTGEDWLDTDSTGFVVNEVSGSNANTNGATYIFLAIA